MDILRDSWLPTDCGLLTPVGALQRATQFKWGIGDWDAASLLYLHALVQTAVVLHGKCPDRKAWARYFDNTPEDLPGWFDGIVLGAAPWQCQTATGELPAYTLLPASPGDNTLKKNADIMAWRANMPSALSVAEAQIAIMADQFFGAKQVGQGYYSGCRGNNPLTVMMEPPLEGASLWQRVWLNILPENDWNMHYATDQEFVFPWDRPLTSALRTPRNTHPLEMLWQMPKRWRMVVSDDGCVHVLHRQNQGNRYDGGWRHPLSSYREKAPDKDGSAGGWFPQRARPHIGYRDWAALAVGLKGCTQPPFAVLRYLDHRLTRSAPRRLRCFGWAAGGKELGVWVDQSVPYYIEADGPMVEAAVADADAVVSQLSKLLGELKPWGSAEARHLYARTEPEFFRRVSEADWDGWRATLVKAARNIVWEFADSVGADVFQTAALTSTLKAPAKQKDAGC